jgi:hypothetical protein
MEERLGDMRDEIDGLKEKDRFRLEEIKVYVTSSNRSCAKGSD